MDYEHMEWGCISVQLRYTLITEHVHREKASIRMFIPTLPSYFEVLLCSRCKKYKYTQSTAEEHVMSFIYSQKSIDIELWLFYGDQIKILTMSEINIQSFYINSSKDC